MANVIQGSLIAGGEKYCIIISRFNEFIGSKLLSGAIDELVRHGVPDTAIDIIWTPGAFEIPLIAQKAARSKKYAAIITLGAVIKGATDHYDFVAGELAKGIAHVALDTGVPVIFGVLTTENLEQAIERAGTKGGNKGSDAAKTAIEMANLQGFLNSPTYLNPPKEAPKTAPAPKAQEPAKKEDNKAQ